MSLLAFLRFAILHGTFLFVSTLPLLAQPSVTFSKLPVDWQLYPRNASNQATVPISGKINTQGYSSISLVVTRNNIAWQYIKTNLSYQNGKASFFLFPVIQAGLYEYRFRLYAKSLTDSILIADKDSITCGDAYLISGQSNARLSDDRETYRNEFCRTFGKTTSNGNATASFLGDTLWSPSLANGYTNVGVWGLQLQHQLVQHYQMPVCLINGGVSQTRIFMHLKNTADPNYFTNTYYGRLYYRVMKAGLLNTTKALFWYQGEANAEDDFSTYLNSFNQLYLDWHMDYPALQRIYLFQINIGCNSNSLSGKFREGQRQMKYLFPDIQPLATVGTPWYNGCHYDTAGYHFIGKQAFKLLANDFYNATPSVNDLSPEIQKAYYTSTSHREIILEFANANMMVWQNDTLGKQLKHYFYLDGQDNWVSSGYATGNKVRLLLTHPVEAKTISYLPDAPLDTVFIGPYLRNSKKLGAFSFYDFPIEGPPIIGKDPGCPGAFGPIKHIYGTNKRNTAGSSISQNTTWHKDSIYVLHDYVRVANATLTIEPGTIVMGSPTPYDTAVLVIHKGAKLQAIGTANSPIVFTSCKIQGARNPGDWGGIVICGNAPNNVGNSIELEGGYRAYHGGTNSADNSGSLQYVRVEYAGVKFNAQEETNGLTLASVGNGTTLKYIQVSHANDDSFEWYGGTVNGRYLISWKALDDDFDTDMGYRGLNQFGLGYRDFARADVSGSSGFESDNNTNLTASPRTAPVFSNFESWGPRVTAYTPYNGFFKAGAHFRNNTEIKLYNTLLLGWPGDSSQNKAALYLEGIGTINNAKNDSIRLRNCIIGSYLPNVLMRSDLPNTSWTPFSSIQNWYYKTGYKDSTANNILLTEKKAPFKEIPLFTISATNSRFNKGSSFKTATLPALPLSPNGFFQNVSYRGAFGGTDWTAGWAEFNSNMVVYAANQYAYREMEKNINPNILSNSLTTLIASPNPFSDKVTLQFRAPFSCKATAQLAAVNGFDIAHHDFEVKEGNNQMLLDLHTYPNGVYCLTLKMGQHVTHTRLVKQ